MTHVLELMKLGTQKLRNAQWWGLGIPSTTTISAPDPQTNPHYVVIVWFPEVDQPSSSGRVIIEAFPRTSLFQDFTQFIQLITKIKPRETQEKHMVPICTHTDKSSKIKNEKQKDHNSQRTTLVWVILLFSCTQVSLMQLID